MGGVSAKKLVVLEAKSLGRFGDLFDDYSDRLNSWSLTEALRKRKRGLRSCGEGEKNEREEIVKPEKQVKKSGETSFPLNPLFSPLTLFGIIFKNKEK